MTVQLCAARLASSTHCRSRRHTLAFVQAKAAVAPSCPGDPHQVLMQHIRHAACWRLLQIVDEVCDGGLAAGCGRQRGAADVALPFQQLLLLLPR